MSKFSIRATVFITLLFFSWSTLSAGGSFTETNSDLFLKKAESLFEKQQYKKAIDVLVFFIKENGKNWSKDLETATAYYILANIYYKNDKYDKKIETLLRNVLRLNKTHKAKGPDIKFNEYFNKIKKEINDETLKKIEKTKKKDKIKKLEENKKIIVKQGKKKKKKFPILLLAGGAAIIIAAVILLSKKEYDSGTNVLANEVYDSIEWMNIPEGEFTMGISMSGDINITNDAIPHKVFLDNFNMSKYEITFEQYDKFCEDTKRDKASDFDLGRGNMPVFNVSWYDAEAFCEWLSKKTGKTIKLPTEAQWEKAARGTDERIYPWGNNFPNTSLCDYNLNGTWGPSPVGSFPLGVSPYGVHDMAGNLWEWCSDWYSITYYKESPEKNPQGPDSGKGKVERGGSWRQDANRLKSASRSTMLPSDKFYVLGFRVVML